MATTQLKPHAQLTMEQRVELAGDLRRLADGPKVTPKKNKEVIKIARDLEKLNRSDRKNSALDMLRRGTKARR